MPELIKDADETSPEGDPQVRGDDYDELFYRPRGEAGSRAWLWKMRAANVGLYAIVSLPFVAGIVEVIKVRAMARIPEEVKIPGVPAKAHLTDWVLVDLDAAWWERLPLVVPGFMTTLLFAIVCYAIWRIEVNMAAGYGFTAKDGAWATRAALIAPFGVVVVGPAASALRLAIAERHHVSSLEANGLLGGYFTVFAVAAVMGSLARVYRQGSKAYKRQQDIV